MKCSNQQIKVIFYSTATPWDVDRGGKAGFIYKMYFFAWNLLKHVDLQRIVLFIGLHSHGEGVKSKDIFARNYKMLNFHKNNIFGVK